MFLELCSKNFRCLLGSFYRHPNSSISLFTTNLESIFQSQTFKKFQSCCIWAGDYNLDILKYDTNKEITRFIDLIISFNFIPLSVIPIRVTNTAASIIDHIYYRPNSKIKDCCTDLAINGCLTVDISDHLANFLILPLICNKSVNIDRPSTRLFSAHNKDKYLNYLLEIDWASIIYNQSDVNIAYSNFSAALSTKYEASFPLVKISRKRAKDKKWVTPEIIKASSHKNSLYKKWLKSKLPSDKEKYKTCLKLFNQSTSRAQILYYNRIFNSNVLSTKKLWKEINNLVNLSLHNKSNNTCTVISKLNINGMLVTDNDKIASELNSYFCNVGAELASKLSSISPSSDFKTFLPPPIQNSFACLPISMNEISNVIYKLKSKNSAGADEFNARLVYSIEPAIVAPLCFIYNLSLTTGVFPDDLKKCKTIPIFKKGDRSTMSNYRPISLLSIFAKILETLVANRLTMFVTKYNILYDYQFGFRQHYSTKLALINSTDDILKPLNEKKIVAGIFFDLAKAFDSIDHSILLFKLQNYGVRGSMLNWFCSYLNSRSQYVKVNNSASNYNNISYGVPQGSVMGPLLFLIYINDLGLFDKSTVNPKLFADDTNIFVSGNSVNDLNNKCQLVVNRITAWTSANMLTLNIEKTYYMIFQPSLSYDPLLKLNLLINNTQINKVTSSKFLGVTIDDRLDWKAHLSDLCLRLRKYVGIFYKLSLKLPPKILKTLYFSLVYPHILYGIEVYANTFACNLHDLMIMNNRILRITQHGSWRCNVLHLYINYNTLPVDKLFQMQILLHAHAIFYESPRLPKIFLNDRLTNSDIHSHYTRSSSDFHRLQVSTTHGSRISSQLISKLWNLLPHLIRSTRDITAFKKSVKLFLLYNSL